MPNKINDLFSKHPATLNVSSRVDHRSIASLAIFWQAQGESAQSISQVVRASLELLLEILKMQDKAIHIESFEEALEVLKGLNLNIPKRSTQMLARELSRQSLEMEGFRVGSVLSGQKISKGHPLVEKATKLLEESESAQESAEEIEAKALASGNYVESEQEGVERRKRELEEEKLEMERLLKGGNDGNEM